MKLLSESMKCDALSSSISCRVSASSPLPCVVVRLRPTAASWRAVDSQAERVPRLARRSWTVQLPTPFGASFWDTPAASTSNSFGRRVFTLSCKPQRQLLGRSASVLTRIYSSRLVQRVPRVNTRVDPDDASFQRHAATSGGLRA